MHTSVHSSVAVASMSLYGLIPIWGLMVLGFFSHYAIDLIGEKPFSYTLEFVLLVALGALILYVGLPIWATLAVIIMANLPDLVDKKLGLSMIWPDKYPATRYFSCHNKDFVKWPLTKTQTITTTVLSTLGVILIWLILI